MLYTLVNCLPIGNHRIQRNDDNRVIIIDSRITKFSPTEYRLLRLLLDGNAVSDVVIARQVFFCEMTASVHENIDKHIDKMRSKLRPLGLNIHRIAKYGYILLTAGE